MVVAKADGEVHPDEEKALVDALQGLDLPGGYTAKALLEEEVALEEILAELKSEEVRRQAFRAAYLMAHVDSKYTAAEQRLIERLREQWLIPQEEINQLDKGLSLADTTLMFSISAPVAAQREDEANRKIKQYLVLTTLTAAIPVPLVGDLMVAPLQMGMVYELGTIYGHHLDKASIKAMLSTFGIGKGLRIAISSLAKLVPGWGSIVGAVGAFSTTYALAQVAKKYFESSRRLSLDSLKPLFAQKEEEGKKQFELQKDSIANPEVAEQIKRIGEKVSTGELKPEQLQRHISELAGKIG